MPFLKSVRTVRLYKEPQEILSYYGMVAKRMHVLEAS